MPNCKGNHPYNKNNFVKKCRAFNKRAVLRPFFALYIFLIKEKHDVFYLILFLCYYFPFTFKIKTEVAIFYTKELMTFGAAC